MIIASLCFFFVLNSLDGRLGMSSALKTTVFFRGGVTTIGNDSVEDGGVEGVLRDQHWINQQNYRHNNTKLRFASLYVGNMPTSDAYRVTQDTTTKSNRLCTTRKTSEREQVGRFTHDSLLSIHTHTQTRTIDTSERSHK